MRRSCRGYASCSAEAGVDEPVCERCVEDDATAQRERFLGSPTLRIDGVDIDPGVSGRTDYGLRCRLYPTEAGLGGMPPDQWVLNALHSAGPSPGGTES